MRTLKGIDIMEPKWQKPLNKNDLKHLKTVAGCVTLKQFKSIVEMHNKLRTENPKTEPCWDCRAIARKLGLEVV